ncbi:hypothetical protein BKA81DRAFT_205728 [Phyllosticta paracitricarpa]
MVAQDEMDIYVTCTCHTLAPTYRCSALSLTQRRASLVVPDLTLTTRNSPPGNLVLHVANPQDRRSPVQLIWLRLPAGYSQASR